MKKMFAVAALGAFGLMGAWAQDQEHPKQEMKDAGHEAKNAAEDAGRGVVHGTKKAGRKVKRGTKRAVHGAARATERGAEKVEDKTANPPPNQ